MSFIKRLNNFLRFVFRILSGILVIVSIVFLIGIGVVVLMNINYDAPFIIILCLIIIGIIVYTIRKKRQLSNTKNERSLMGVVVEILKVGFILFVFGKFLIQLNLPQPLTRSYTDDGPRSEEVVLYTDSTTVLPTRYYQSEQTWYDFRRKKHRMIFKVEYDSVIKSTKNRDSLEWRDFRKLVKTEDKDNSSGSRFRYVFEWGELYDNLVKHDKSLVESLSSEFYNYQKQHQLNRKQFAELIITSIQDIPYGLVLIDTCGIKPIKPCLEKIKFGVFAPAEFISNLHGDCDTRTVLLFTLLSRFNYDVAILNSSEYAHSMLGLHIAATGKYKSYKRKKYYFIETTNKGWSIGTLPKDYSNIDFWDLVLIHNTTI